MEGGSSSLYNANTATLLRGGEREFVHVVKLAKMCGTISCFYQVLIFTKPQKELSLIKRCSFYADKILAIPNGSWICAPY